MARPAPAVDRTVALMTFLSQHPGRSFSLSELARQLDLNKATAHAMIAALTGAGWLLRDPTRKDYRLGPALVAVANAAAATERVVLEAARSHMRQLALDLGVQCIASAAMGEEIVILANEGRGQPLGVGSEPGRRVPMVPPLGTVFVAWSDQETVDRWLGGLGADPDGTRLERYRAAVAAVRTRGYAMGLEGHPREHFGEALAELAADASGDVRKAVAELLRSLEREQDDYLLTNLEGSALYQLGMLSAPVFDADGEVVLAITLTGFGRPLTASQVPAYATPLVAATEAVTRAINGRAPALPDAPGAPPARTGRRRTSA